MKRGLIIGLIVMAAALGVLYWRVRPQSKETAIHYHGGFVVFKGGQKVDFSGDQYMHIAPCTTKETAQTPAEIQLDKAHLHDNVGDVVHIHEPGAVWGDLFTNLKYLVEPAASTSAYLNGVKAENITLQPIKPYYSLVLLIGAQYQPPEYYLNQAVIKDHILKVEQTSENCGS